MSRGKYSLAYKDWGDDYEYKYNCYGRLPEPWTDEMRESGVTFNRETMMDGYDEEGYDYYGYSAFDRDGQYVGNLSGGSGVDRAGWTEFQYLTLEDLSPWEREHFYD
jgi:hypothetical protein